MNRFEAKISLHGAPFLHDKEKGEALFCQPVWTEKEWIDSNTNGKLKYLRSIAELLNKAGEISE